MKLLIALSLALISNAVCSFNSTGNKVIPRGRILKGQDAEPKQFPYVVGVRTKHKGYNTWCGGSLIGQEWVLTAAHCLIDFTEIEVLLGATDRLKPELRVTVKPEHVFRNPHYDQKKYINDIGLIKIPKTTFTSTIAAVKLPDGTSQNYVKKNAYVAGWGITAAGSDDLSKTLKWGSLNIIDNKECKKTYKNSLITAHKLCASTKKVATCQGDSGGPLVLESEKILIGVASFVSKDGCGVGSPAIFTNIAPYVPWIKFAMKKY